MAGEPKVYVGATALGGSTPRHTYISISNVAKLPPIEWPCAWGPIKHRAIQANTKSTVVVGFRD
jgi:hypothetical protein